MNKKIIIEEKPSKPMFPSDIAQGNKNAISKSNIINKNIIIDVNPSIPMFAKEIAHGNKNAISKSKIIKRIATR